MSEEGAVPGFMCEMFSPPPIFEMGQSLSPHDSGLPSGVIDAGSVDLPPYTRDGPDIWNNSAVGESAFIPPSREQVLRLNTHIPLEIGFNSQTASSTSRTQSSLRNESLNISPSSASICVSVDKSYSTNRQNLESVSHYSVSPVSSDSSPTSLEEPHAPSGKIPSQPAVTNERLQISGMINPVPHLAEGQDLFASFPPAYGTNEWSYMESESEKDLPVVGTPVVRYAVRI